jgi:ribosome biogenesis GTPase
MIANVDCGLIVTSLIRPDLSTFLLDKMIVNLSINNIEPILVFTKYDLLTDIEKKKYDEIIEYYRSVGYKAIINHELDKLDEYIDGKVVVLTGQTGVGKSTLVNKLLPGLNLETNDISDALGRGKHTTRHVELYEYKNSYIVDTPGFSSLDVSKDEKENYRFYFPEFDNDSCKFRDCKHINEIGCKVKEDVENNKILQSRYENYKKMVMDDENFNINN